MAMYVLSEEGKRKISLAQKRRWRLLHKQKSERGEVLATECTTDDMVKRAISNLPQGTSVTDKPLNAELLVTHRSMYTPYVEALRVLPAEKCLQLNIEGATENRIAAIKVGIRKAAKELKYNKNIRFLQQGGLLLVF